ncbi:MAG: cysteine--tRNA ligase [Candidatus Saccharimonadales bacterium]
MTLKFHNTLTGHDDEFVSQVPGKVSLYTCGPTVYDYPHIGNWAAYIFWDILVRILKANNYDVTRVMNMTDVGHLVSDADEGEDKLEKGARREGKTAWEVAEFYANVFTDGMNRLGLIMPNYITKATEFIPEQIKMIEILKEKGVTYEIDDGIYFDISKFPRYADFAHLDLDALQAGARVEYNPQKRNHSDFALWKFSPAGEKRDMEWEYDGRMGFPGWHLECSAMALAKLGKTIDIHTGGIDHIPVHHPNEIAQSETANGVRFSNYWMHNNFLKVDGGKFSKSLGNGYTLDQLEERGFSMMGFRMFMLQGHYRSESNFTFDNLQAAKNRLHNWRNIAALRHQIHDTIESDKDRNADNKTLSLYATSQAVIEAVSNDLNTPEALKIIDEAFSRVQNAKLDDINSHAFLQLLETIDQVLGLQLLNTSPDISDEAKQLIIERNIARENKDWQESDRLRKKLSQQGTAVRDANQNSIWMYEI